MLVQLSRAFSSASPGATLGLIGAYLTVSVITTEKALEIGVSRWAGESTEENAKLPLVRELLSQSAEAKRGVWFIVVGFALQFGAAAVSAFPVISELRSASGPGSA